MRYQYLALDPQGQEITGFISADGERDAARQLRRQDLTLLELRASGARAVHRQGRGKPKARDLLVLLHELATLLESEVALIDAVQSLAESSHHPHLTQACVDIAARLRHGAAFSSALRESPLALPPFVTQLVEAGELTGKVDQALRDGVNQMEYEQRVQGEMRNALIYPSILVISGISAVMLIFVLVVPRFANILANKTGEIPWLAQAVLSTGMFFNQYIVWIVGAGLGLGFAGYHALGNPRWRARMLDGLIRAPMVGTWIMEAETGRWAAMMGTLLENRVPLLRALELAQETIRLPGLRARLNQVTKAVRAGSGLSRALEDLDALSSTGHNLIRAGERAGALPRMLRSLARLLEESGRARMKRFLLLLEPIAILLIGGAIGVIITGVMLAITSVNQINF